MKNTLPGAETYYAATEGMITQAHHLIHQNPFASELRNIAHQLEYYCGDYHEIEAILYKHLTTAIEELKTLI